MPRDFGLGDVEFARGSTAAGHADWNLGQYLCGSRRQQEEPVCESHRFVQVVGHKQRGYGAILDQHRKFVAQLRRQRGIERGERLIEQEQFRLHRKGARQRDATRQPEREFARDNASDAGSARERQTMPRACDSALRRDQTDVVLNRSPRQQPRFLEYHAEPAAPGATTVPS